MLSHRYDFTPADVCRVLGPPLAPVVVFSVALHLGAALGCLPKPKPTLDMDRTILIHQAEASHSASGASVLFVGDSSCLMDVQARPLGELLSAKVLNVATLSYLDLETHGLLVSQYARANPGCLRTVVLLMHPSVLRLPESSGYHSRVVRAFLQGQVAGAVSGWRGEVADWLGWDTFRQCFLGRIQPTVLPGAYGARYGFTSDLWTSLTRHQGSAVDPHQYDPGKASGNAECRLAKGLEARSRAFRQSLPSGVRLAVGLTPSPESFVLRDHPEQCQALLRQWGQWLQADLLLTNLPFSFPDDCFASVNHLNAAGAERYTQLLARSLRPSPGRE